MAQLVSSYRKESNTEITEKGQSTESTEKEKQNGSEDHYKKPLQKAQLALAGGAVFLRIEQLGEARVFLEESKIFVVARVIAVFGAQLNGDFQIGQSGPAYCRDEGRAKHNCNQQRFRGADF